MAILIIFTFIVGYFMIAMEHPFKLDKAASALLTGVLCWVILLAGLPQMPAFIQDTASLPVDTHKFIQGELIEHLGDIASILFFLLGAMTVVELVDVHDGFRVITDRITTKNLVKLLWVMSWVSFFLSSVLDNMTTAIIMCALARKLTTHKETLWLIGGFVIIAANSGGAWSPIGDVTTIMLWIGGQVTTLNIMKSTFLASFMSLLVPLLLASYFVKGQIESLEKQIGKEETQTITTPAEKTMMFFLGALALLFVPVFKYFTGLPPFMGILLSVGILWYITELMHRRKDDVESVRREYSVAAMLHRIDTPSVLFFLGILLAVSALEVSGHLHHAATLLDQTFGNIYVINTLIGLLSAVVDNVPLVAASMGMYDLTRFPPDHDFWNLLAYCAGTGGSILIIGSAAGVASMGILKIDFLWYLKRISLYALAGYLSGIASYYFEHLL
jgi:Na+/H+ antiporter NhaD/arsenite permease-like protein